MGARVSIYYVHSDQLNTPRQITRPSDNAQLWTWFSDPFGTDAANSNPAGVGTFAYNLRLPGQIFDGQAGLHQNGFRDYDPAIGGYIESDPLGLDSGINTYAYVEGDPLSAADPLGLESIFPFRPELVRPFVEPTRPWSALIRPGDIVDPLYETWVDPDTGMPDPNKTRACRDMWQRVLNLRKEIEKRTEDLRTNPRNLPERIQLTRGYRMRMDVRGHRKLLNRQWNELRKREKEFEEKCRMHCGE